MWPGHVAGLQRQQLRTLVRTALPLLLLLAGGGGAPLLPAGPPVVRAQQQQSGAYSFTPAVSEFMLGFEDQAATNQLFFAYVYTARTGAPTVSLTWQSTAAARTGAYGVQLDVVSAGTEEWHVQVYSTCP